METKPKKRNPTNKTGDLRAHASPPTFIGGAWLVTERTPTERAEARAQEEARAHSRLTRAEVERVLASVPPETGVVVQELIGKVTRDRSLPALSEREFVAVFGLLLSLAEGLA
jgi:hypothetical protein